MKKVLLVLSMLATLVFTACGGAKEEAKPEAKALKVGIVLSTGGLGDKSFNDSAFRGLENAKKDLGIEFKYVEPASPAEDSQFLKEFAEGGYDLVIGVGFMMKDSVEKIAAEYPNVKFALIDDVAKGANVRNLVFKEQEGSFLVGAAAAMVSKTGTVGFVGGGDFPLIQKFQRGFEQGAKYVNPNAKVITVYLSGDNPFNDPVKAKEITISEVKQGADVVYHAAGASGIGVINAAKEAKIFAIGVDSNQDDIAPGTVLTSMIKNVDVTVYDTVKALQEGKFEAGEAVFGVKENGVGTSDFKNTKDVIGEENLKKLDELKAKIISGEIVVK